MASNGQLDNPALTLQLLSTADTTLVTVQPQFLQTLSDHLGDHLTPDDGFDALLNDPISSIDPDSSSVDSLEAISPDVAALPAGFSPAALNSIAEDVATFNASGDNIAQGFGAATAPPSTPPADTTGFKNTGDGGGGGGSTPPPRPDQGNPDLGGVEPPMDSPL